MATSSRQCTCSCNMSRAEFFGKTSNHPSDSAPLQPRSGTLQLMAFPNTKMTFEREEISDCRWDSGKYNETADDDLWGPKVPTLRGIEVSLSYVQYVLYLVSFSVNVCIFHITWLHIFRTDLTYTESYHDPLLSPLVATSLG